MFRRAADRKAFTSEMRLFLHHARMAISCARKKCAMAFYYWGNCQEPVSSIVFFIQSTNYRLICAERCFQHAKLSLFSIRNMMTSSPLIGERASGKTCTRPDRTYASKNANWQFMLIIEFSATRETFCKLNQDVAAPLTCCSPDDSKASLIIVTYGRSWCRSNFRKGERREIMR